MYVFRPRKGVHTYIQAVKKVHFFSETPGFLPKNRLLLRQWITQLFELHETKLLCVNYIFCTDAEILVINQQYLNHDTFTDIITFDNTEDKNAGVESDIFISVERTKENAEQYNCHKTTELHRVMAHGALHLMGFKDKTKEQKAQMRTEENKALLLLETLRGNTNTLKTKTTNDQRN